MQSLRVSATYDDEVDAGYVQFGPIQPGEAVRQESVWSDSSGGQMILDFDREGRLLGIELLGVTQFIARPSFEDLTP